MFQSVQVSNTNSIGAAVCVAEYVDNVFNDETGQCDVYKKILILTSKCEEEDCFYWYRNGVKLENPPTEEQLMAFNLIPAPVSQKKCERYTTEPFIIDNANANDITLADLVTLAFDNDGGSLEFPTFGAVAADDEVLNISVVAEDGDDVVLIDGQESGGFSWTTDTTDASTFPGQTPVTVPEGCEFSVSVCFRKCLSKAEQAAL